MEEVAYLLKTIANAKELLDSIDEANQGKTIKIPLVEVDA